MVLTTNTLPIYSIELFFLLDFLFIFVLGGKFSNAHILPLSQERRLNMKILGIIILVILLSLLGALVFFEIRTLVRLAKDYKKRKQEEKKGE